jgi:hypothetical protein
MDTFFQQDGTRSYTANVVLDVLCDVFSIRALSNRIPKRFGCGWSWPPRSPGLESLRLFRLGLPQRLCVPHKPAHCSGVVSGK